MGSVRGIGVLESQQVVGFLKGIKERLRSSYSGKVL